MLEKVKDKIARYYELEELMASPEVTANPEKLKTVGKEFNELESAVGMLKEYVEAVEGKKEAEALISEGSESDLIELAYEEIKKYNSRIPELEEQIKGTLVPKDPADEKNAIVEIRAGTGGVEAGIFASDLYKMISNHAENKGWKIEVMNTSHGEMEALKEVIFMVKGNGAYGRLKFESGVHRVQRVPKTESQGRIHTSAASIAVLPEATDIEVEISQNDLRFDVYRSSGPGGQSVNTTDSAVRITHIPTNTVVTCQDEKSQHKNKAKALKVLRSRLYNEEKKRQHEKESAYRKSMVGSGDRSSKIRTYNFPQERVTDHRINLTLHALTDILNGNLDILTDKLIDADIQSKLND